MKKGIAAAAAVIVLIIAAVIFQRTVFKGALPGPFPGKTQQVIISGMYGQTEARNMLSIMNQFRKGSDAWWWNESDSEKIAADNLPELTYDYALERAAMQRAAEIAVSFSETRTDGSAFWTAYPNDFTYESKGENIIAGPPTEAEAFEIWKEDDKKYAGQTQRRNLLNSSFTAVGIAHMTVGGTHYWVQEFGSSNSQESAVPANDAFTDVLVDLSADAFSVVPSVSETEISLELNEAKNLPRVKAEISSNIGTPAGEVDAALAVSWTSSDPSIAKIEENTVLGTGTGTAELSADAAGVVLKVPVDVSLDPISASLLASASTAENASSVAVNVQAKGGSGIYTYKYALRDIETGVEEILLDYTEDPSYTIDVTTIQGKVFTVYVRDSEGAECKSEVDYTALREMAVPLTGDLDTGGRSGAKSGEQVILTAHASGGTGEYSYKFMIYDDSSRNRYLLRDFSSDGSAVWIPGAAGTKTLLLDIRDSSGSQTRISVSGFEIEAKDENMSAVMKSSLYSDTSGTPVSEVTSGTKVLLTAKASGGKGPYTYKFLLFDNGSGKWHVIRDYSYADSCTWETGAEGTKTLFVDVKDTEGEYVRVKQSNFKVKKE